MKKISAIVLAAGKGSRMKSDTKKQFMSISDKPMLYYSLSAFEKSTVDQVIVVTSQDDIDYVQKEIVSRYGFGKVTDIVAGGKERYNSVMNGLEKVSGDIVLIHDGARPMIDLDIINNCIKGVEEHRACVAGVSVKDTIKVVEPSKKIISTPNRDSLYITQTPQAFETDLIKTAYSKMQTSGDTDITDDAMVVERYTDNDVYFVESDYKNIKVTTPEDILLAEVLLKK